MYGKKRPLAILCYQLHIYGGFNFKFTGGGNTPAPWEDVLQKKNTKEKKERKEKKRKEKKRKEKRKSLVRRVLRYTCLNLIQT